MTSVERVEQLLNMEVRISERDDADIIIASRVDSATRRKTLEDVIRYLKAHELEDKQDDV
jgi:hypothetical protein